MQHHRIMLVGENGTGKSSQLLTLDGPALCLALDPNAFMSLGNYKADLEIHPIQPTFDDLSIEARTLKNRTTAKAPKLYDRFVDELKKIDFAKYKWLFIDSQTYLGQAALDAAKFANKGTGEGRSDYMIAGEMVYNINRALVSLPINIVVTGHYKSYTDEKTMKRIVQLNLPGSSRDLLPTMYGNIFSTFIDVPIQNKKATGLPSYKIQTVRDETNPCCRTTLKGLETIEDITLDFTQDLTKQGIGRWFND